MLHEGKLYHAGDLTRPFNHVTSNDLERWEKQSLEEFREEIAIFFNSLSLARIPRPRIKWDNLQCKETFCADFEVKQSPSDYILNVNKFKVSLFVYAVEWLFEQEVAIYNEVYIQWEVKKIDRPLFRITLTIILYGPKGG